MSPVRFVFAVLVFLISTLVLLPAPNLLLWQLKLGATEYSAWFFIVALVLIFLGRRSVLDSVSAGLAAIAALLFLSCPLRASMFAGTAKAKMNATFPATTPMSKGSGYSFFRCWGFGKPAPVDVQDYVFADHDDGSLSLDFYHAEGRQNAPCVLVLHTGGWDNHTRKEFIDFNNLLARRGIAMASMDYRLAPAHPWPAQREDTRAAIGFLMNKAEELGIDPKKIVLLGRSAGGQIAQAVAATGESGVAGCISFYAPADLRFAFQYADEKDILNSSKLLKQFLGGTPDEKGDLYDSATAFGRVGEKTPPMLLIHGAHDELVWCKQSERFDDHLRTAGVKHVFLKLPWATHAFDYNFRGPGGQIAAWAVERFVNAL